MTRYAPSLCLLLFAMQACQFDFEESAQCYLGEDCGQTEDTPLPPTDSTRVTDEGVSDTSVPPDTQPEVANDTVTQDDTDTTVDTQPPLDPDQDGITDNDNCPEQWNPSQLDYDGDLIGDECDPCPFVAVVREPGTCYPTAFDSVQLLDADAMPTGWTAHIVQSDATGTDLTVETLALNFEAASYSTAEGIPQLMTLHPGGLLHLTWLTESGGIGMDGMLVMDATRQLAIGHLFVSKGQEKAPGVPEPANLVILLRNRRFPPGQPADFALPELFATESTDTWTLTGWLQGQSQAEESETESAVLSLQSRLRMTSAEEATEPGFQIQAHDAASDTGSFYLFNESAPSTPTLASSAAPPVLSQPGSLHDELGVAQMTLPGLLSATSDLVLEGQFSFSGQLAILQSTSAKHPGFFLLVRPAIVDNAAMVSDPRLGRYAVLGAATADTTVRGLLTEGLSNTAPFALLLHEATSLPVATETTVEDLHVTPSWIGWDSQASIAGLTPPIEQPRTCLSTVAGHHVGLIRICPSDNLAAEAGCAIETPCWVSLGLAIQINDDIHAKDLDLDGKASDQITASDCVGTGADTCPCIINPHFDCPSLP